MVPVLQTARLRLRGHVPADFAASAAMWADPEVVRFITGRPLDRHEAWQRFLRYPGHWAMLGFGYWLVETRADASFVGEVGIADYHRPLNLAVDGIPEAGWVLCRQAHGQGYATEAMRAVLGWADRRFARTFALFDPDHADSLRVAARLGYGTPTGVMWGDRQARLLWRNAGAAPAA